MKRLLALTLLASIALVIGTAAQTARVRARDLGIVVGSLPPGRLNAITDVAGVLVGHATIVRGDGALKVGEGPVRTGVTAVLPRKDIWFNGVYAATHTLNGDGEMTGTHWIRDRETLMHPVLITNTGSVGTVHEAEIAYMNERHPTRDWAFLPVVAETWDGTLNDVRGQHVKKSARLRRDRRGQGRRGRGGQRRRRHRHGLLRLQGRHRHVIPTRARERRRVHGRRARAGQLRAAAGAHGGRCPGRSRDHRSHAGNHSRRGPAGDINLDHEGSVIVVIATDAPLSSRQLERIAARAALGLARTGSTSGNSSGDIFIAFSTGNTVPQSSDVADAVGDVRLARIERRR